MTEVILPGLAGRLEAAAKRKKDDPERDGRFAGLHRGTLSKDRVWKDQSFCPPADGAGRTFCVTTDYLLGRD